MKLSTAETINAVSNKTQEESDAMAESMATKFGAVQLLGVFIAPINGYIIDNSKSYVSVFVSNSEYNYFLVTGVALNVPRFCV